MMLSYPEELDFTSVVLQTLLGNTITPRFRNYGLKN